MNLMYLSLMFNNYQIDLLVPCLGNINLAADILKLSCRRRVRDLHLLSRLSLNLLCGKTVDACAKIS